MKEDGSKNLGRTEKRVVIDKIILYDFHFVCVAYLTPRLLCPRAVYME